MMAAYAPRWSVAPDCATRSRGPASVEGAECSGKTAASRPASRSASSPWVWVVRRTNAPGAAYGGARGEQAVHVFGEAPSRDRAVRGRTTAGRGRCRRSGVPGEPPVRRTQRHRPRASGSAGRRNRTDLRSSGPMRRRIGWRPRVPPSHRRERGRWSLHRCRRTGGGRRIRVGPRSGRRARARAVRVRKKPTWPFSVARSSRVTPSTATSHGSGRGVVVTQPAGSTRPESSNRADAADQAMGTRAGSRAVGAGRSATTPPSDSRRRPSPASRRAYGGGAVMTASSRLARSAAPKIRRDSDTVSGI